MHSVKLHQEQVASLRQDMSAVRLDAVGMAARNTALQLQMIQMQDALVIAACFGDGGPSIKTNRDNNNNRAGSRDGDGGRNDRDDVHDDGEVGALQRRSPRMLAQMLSRVASGASAAEIAAEIAQASAGSFAPSPPGAATGGGDRGGEGATSGAAGAGGGGVDQANNNHNNNNHDNNNHNSNAR